MGSTQKRTELFVRASRIALVLAAGLIGDAVWQVIARRPGRAGLDAGASGICLLLCSGYGRLAGRVAEPLLASLLDRAFDGCILGAIAWASRGSDPAISAAALVALTSGFLCTYVRARGASLGYPVEEWTIARVLRYGLVSAGLLAGWLGAALWTVAGLNAALAFVRVGRVVKEERA